MAHPACQLRIQQTREESIFHLDGVQDWTRSLLETAIFKLGETPTRDLGHLAVGVRALAQMKVRPFSLRYPTGEHVAWTGKGFTELPKESGEMSGLTLRVANFEFGQSRSIFSLDNIQALNLRADITTALAGHCHLAKQIFTIDGRPVTSHLHDPQFGITDKSRPLAFLRCPPTPELPSLVIAESEDWEPVELGQHTVSLDSEVLKSLSQGQECSAAALVCAFIKRRRINKNVEYFEGTEGRSEVVWVADGVVVLREPLPVEQVAGVGVVVSAEGLPTDLTGLQPKKDAELKRRRQVAIRLVHQQLEELIRLETDGADLSYSHFKTYLVGALGAVCMFVFPMGGLALLTKAGYEYTSAGRRTKYLDQAFDQGLKRVTRSFGKLANRES